MNNDTRTAPGSTREAAYRERLSPSLWTLLSAALAGPMVTLVFVPLNAAIALLIGLSVATLLLFALVALSPVVSVTRGELRVGRAHIPVAQLGTPHGAVGDEARHARGPGLSRHSWHLLRGGIDGVVRVPVADERDPVDEWVFSTRTPDRVVAAIVRAQQT